MTTNVGLQVGRQILVRGEEDINITFEEFKDSQTEDQWLITVIVNWQTGQLTSRIMLNGQQVQDPYTGQWADNSQTQSLVDGLGGHISFDLQQDEVRLIQEQLHQIQEESKLEEIPSQIQLNVHYSEGRAVFTIIMQANTTLDQLEDAIAARIGTLENRQVTNVSISSLNGNPVNRATITFQSGDLVRVNWT